MADWRQIQARIRKAKSGPDAPGKLAELYERTRDAMVAFELAQWQEKAGEHAEAARWYTAAAERFRRAQWRTKAEAALARLGAPKPAPSSSGSANGSEASDVHAEPPARESSSENVADFAASNSDVTPPEASPEEGSGDLAASEETAAPRETTPASASGFPPEGKRRRGRRGGRNRRRGGRTAGVGRAPVPAPGAQRTQPSAHTSVAPIISPPAPDTTTEVGTAADQAPDQRDRVGSAWQGRSRTGDPAFASRLAQLESQLRRLLACPQMALDAAEQAPAGPGVLLLSDSDLVTHYYVEACQTLRTAIGNLLRGGRRPGARETGAKDGAHLKERLAENLGISQSRVANYLKDHCAVRWLQLDEGTSELAHFAIAVLRPVVNE